MGSGTVLVHSMYTTADDSNEDFKYIFFLVTYGTFKGCRGIVRGLFLFNSLLNTCKNVRNCQMLPSFKRIVRYHGHQLGCFSAQSQKSPVKTGLNIRGLYYLTY